MSQAQAQSYWEPHFIARMGIIYLQTNKIGTGNVLLFGDSNTEAYWWNQNNSGSCWIMNAGFGGATIHDIAIRAVAVAEATQPKIVHLMIGTNDLGSISPSTRTDLQTIYNAFLPYGSIMIAWPIPPFGENFGDVTKLSNRNTLNSILEEVASVNNAKWDWWWPLQIEKSDGYAVPGSLVSDGVHFSASTQTSRYYRIDTWNNYVGGCH